MTSAYSRPEVQKIQSAARSEAVFNVNQTSLGATHQVCPTHNDASLKDSAEIPTLIHLHYCLPRPRHFTMTDWALWQPTARKICFSKAGVTVPPVAGLRSLTSTRDG